MRDERFYKLAKQIVSYSIDLQKGEKVLIDVNNNAVDFAKALVNESYKVGAIPFVNLENSEIKRELLIGLNSDQVDKMIEFDIERMKQIDAYIVIKNNENSYELSDVPANKMALYSKYTKEIHSNNRMNKKWCIIGYPSKPMAQLSGMSTEQFEDYFFNVCCLNYKKLRELLFPLRELMENTDKVRIIAKDTDITFSIKGLFIYASEGKVNVPDGEICTNTVQGSANGHITYNIPSPYQGFVFTNVRLELKDGVIIKANANDTKRINEILDIDYGARRIGEFAIGVNPNMTTPITDILFDEKMTGSLHFTPGNGGENTSAIHWDLVQSHLPEYGGGEIWFDDILIRKDGVFVLDNLKHLNPENLSKEI